ncbi:hypothetical protein JOC75_004721 [Metabacillus crassostreae]|nr:YezD family protein [Metabacillus crassostreae]MBM7606667.1 hypothetical protein [Metabacillus crassostreae]
MVRNNSKQEVIDKIASLLEDIEFGTLQITIHDSQVTQIEKSEKYRFAFNKGNEETQGKKK